MAANYTLLEKITVGAAGASSVTFSGIPQTGYTDLVVKASARDTYAAVSTAFYLEFNGSTGANYNMRRLRGTGSVADSYSESNTTSINLYNIKPGSSATANTFGNAEIYIPNYTSSNNKSVSVDGVGENNATEAYAVLFAGLWAQTNSITSIKLYAETSFVQYSTFYLYGVAKLGTTPAIVPYATGGDTIMTDGTYWYHTFKASGTFTPAKALSCDVLVVAGGGGGGGYWGGGGGAGGFRTATAFSVTSAATVTIGAGGSGGAGAMGSVGNNSVFSTITSNGGGAGGYANNGGAGGSGGGAGSSGIAQTGGAGTAGQGNNGGNASTAADGYSGGGGGGAGAVGGNASSALAGNGGNGTSNSYSGSAVTYAGGGGGGIRTGTNGTGGTGGGGAGGVGNGGSNNGTAGTANTGGGGGGGGGSTGTPSGGNGGSGIVLVRYLV